MPSAVEHAAVDVSLPLTTRVGIIGVGGARPLASAAAAGAGFTWVATVVEWGPR